MAKIAVATRAELKHDMDYLQNMKQLKEGNMDRTTKKAVKLTLKHEKRYEE